VIRMCPVFLTLTIWEIAYEFENGVAI
jgi:hypothetical protein